MGITAGAMRSDERILKLYQGAVRRGFIDSGERDRLFYFAAAEHALEFFFQRNNRKAFDDEEGPGNHLAGMILNGDRGVITERQEERAQARVKRLFLDQELARKPRTEEEAFWTLQRSCDQKVLQWRRKNDDAFVGRRDLQ